MSNLLGTIATLLVNWLLGRFFPAHPKITPEVVAQAQKDRADVLQSQKDAHQEADNLRAHGAARAAAEPESVFKHDANQRD